MPPMLSVLELQPTLSPRPWGGTRLRALFGAPGADPVGEAWLASSESTIACGPFAGRSVHEALRELGPAFLGSAAYGRYGLELPLLVKLLDTADWLSVQVHPDDAYAQRHEAETGYTGKNEAWYILDAVPGAEIVYGLERSVDAESMRRAVQEGRLETLLRREPARIGDVVHVAAGTVHTLGPGLFIYEVQQPSDLTYRLFDFGRGRELHLEKSLDVARLCRQQPDRPARHWDGRSEVLLAAEDFMLCRHLLGAPRVVHAPEESASIFTCVGGGMVGTTLIVGAGRAAPIGAGLWCETFVPAAARLAALPRAVRVGAALDGT